MTWIRRLALLAMGPWEADQPSWVSAPSPAEQEDSFSTPHDGGKELMRQWTKCVVAVRLAATANTAEYFRLNYWDQQQTLVSWLVFAIWRIIKVIPSVHSYTLRNVFFQCFVQPLLSYCSNSWWPEPVCCMVYKSDDDRFLYSNT